MVGKTKVKGYVSSEEVSESEKCESARGDLLKVYLPNARASSVGDEPGLRGGEGGLPKGKTLCEQSREEAHKFRYLAGDGDGDYRKLDHAAAS